MGVIEWAMWANEQALVSSAVLLIGAICGVVGQFKFWQFSAYAIAASVFLFILEYPRSRRKKGTSVPRKFQKPFAIIVNALGPFTKNYFSRFVIHMILCIPCCFSLPTVFGGICLIFSSIIYFVAAIKGEEWLSQGGAKDKQDRGKGPVEPPNKPPPRLPQDVAQAQI